jgi:hypothetical protein
LLLVAGLEPGDHIVIQAWRNRQVFRAGLTVAERPLE